MTPLGRSVVGGLTTSTLITVILIPTLYWVVETKIRKREHAGAHSGITPISSFADDDDAHTGRTGTNGNGSSGNAPDYVHTPTTTPTGDRHDD